MRRRDEPRLKISARLTFWPINKGLGGGGEFLQSQPWGGSCHSVQSIVQERRISRTAIDPRRMLIGKAVYHRQPNNG